MRRKAAQAGIVSEDSVVEMTDTNIVDLDKVIGIHKVANAPYYGTIISDMLASGKVSGSSLPVLEMLRDIMLLDVSIDVRRQIFEPVCFPNRGSNFQIAADRFRPHTSLLSVYSERVTNPVVGARLAHLVWFLEPNRKESGLMALKNYARIIGKLDKGSYSISGHRRNSNFAIIEIMRSMFDVLYRFSYPNDKNRQFMLFLKKMIQKSYSERDVFSYFCLIELMIRNSKSDLNDVEAMLKRLVYGRGIGMKLCHKAYAFRLLAMAYKEARKNDMSLVYAKKAVDVYIRLYENCIRSRNIIEALVWLDTAIYCYQSFGDRRYVDLRAKKRRNERYILKRLASSYSQNLGFRNKLKINVNMSSITLPEALYEFTTLANSPNPRSLLTQAKEIVKSCPVFGQIGLPDVTEKAGVSKVSYRSYNRRKVDDSEYEMQIHHIENIRRLVLVRDGITTYRTIIGYFLRISKLDIMNVIQHSPVVHPCFVDTISDGFDRYFRGETTAAFHILIPMLEGIVRRALMISGNDVSVYNVSTGVQSVRTISSIFDNMKKEVEEIFGSAITADIERVFLSKSGPYLRHGLAHSGLNDKVPDSHDSIYALWLIWRLIALPLVPKWSEVASF